MRVLFATTSAAVLAMMVGAAPAGALTLSAPAAMRGAVTQIDVAQNVARVCRDVCNDRGFCQRRCWNEQSYRTYDDDDIPPRVYERRRVYEGPPGVGIYGPGIGIELGPRW
jgi:hypothetical protein